MVLYTFPLSWGTTLYIKAGWSILGPVYPQTLHYKGMANIFNILFFCFIFSLYLSEANIPHSVGIARAAVHKIVGAYTPTCFILKINKIYLWG